MASSAAIRRWFWRGVVLVAISIPTAVEAQPPFTGPEFQVNQYSTYDQRRPRIASDDSGAFVVVWSSDEQDGSEYGVFVRRFGADGAPLGGDQQVHVATAGVQDEPAVAVDDDGDFVVVWRDASGGAAGDEILARRFDSSGAAQGDPFPVNTFTTGNQHQPAVAMDSGGAFVVVWSSEEQDGSGDGVFGRRFDASGTALSDEFPVNTYTTAPQYDARIAMHDDGRFVVVWASYEQDGSDDAVMFQRFDASATPQGDETQVNVSTLSWQHFQSIGMDATGRFVVAWHGYQPDGAFSDVFARRYDADGSPLTGEFQVNTFTESYQEATAVAMAPAGDFVVVWDGQLEDGYAYGIFGRQFAADGTPASDAFQINSATFGYQRFPTATRQIDGKFVVVWQSGGGNDGFGYGVFGQRFGEAGPVLDVDGNGAITALSDGLLVLRWMGSDSGAALVDGAVAPDCAEMRCTAEQIAAYLVANQAVLDVDDNGMIEPLFDGVLIARYLFGLRADALVGGAVGAGAQRDEAMEIEDHLASLTV